MRRSLKPIVIASSAILTALSLAAAPQEPPPAAASTTTATTTETTASTALVPLQTPVSSLAAAAQRANAARGKTKSRISITNATLSKTGGHITTSSGGGMPLPADPAATGTTPTGADAKKSAVADQGKKKGDEGRKQRMEHAGNVMEGTALDADVDPSRVEYGMTTTGQSTQGQSTTQSTTTQPTTGQPTMVQTQPPQTVPTEKPPH